MQNGVSQMGALYLGARPLRPKKNTHARPLPIVSTCAILCTRVLPKPTLPKQPNNSSQFSSLCSLLGVAPCCLRISLPLLAPTASRVVPFDKCPVIVHPLAQRHTIVHGARQNLPPAIRSPGSAALLESKCKSIVQLHAYVATKTTGRTNDYLCPSH